MAFVIGHRAVELALFGQCETAVAVSDRKRAASFLLVVDDLGAASDPGVMAGFGEITGSANTPRQFQFGARFTFSR